jgi:hypothetical protein
MADTGNVTLVIDAKAAAALNNLSQVAQRMEKIKKETQGAAQAGKQLQGFGRGIGTQATAALGAVGLGGIALTGGIGAIIGSSLFAVGELIGNKIAESNRKLAEAVANGDKKNVQDIMVTSKGIKNMSQAEAIDISTIHGVSIDSIKQTMDEVGDKSIGKRFERRSELLDIIRRVDKINKAGLYREGIANYLRKHGDESNDDLTMAMSYNGRRAEYIEPPDYLKTIQPYIMQKQYENESESYARIAAQRRRQAAYYIYSNPEEYIRASGTNRFGSLEASPERMEKDVLALKAFAKTVLEKPEYIDEKGTFFEMNASLRQAAKDLQNINSETVKARIEKQNKYNSSETGSEGR